MPLRSQPTRRRLAPLAAAIVLCLAGPLLAPFPPPARAQDAAPVTAAPTAATADLAAMLLTPDDLAALGLPGFAIDGGDDSTLEEAALRGAEGRGGASPENVDRVTGVLEDAGWRRAVGGTLATPSPRVPDRFARSVQSYVDDYATADGAATAFAFFNDASTIDALDVEEVDGRRTFGDESRLFRFRGTDTDTGDRFGGLALSFRLGNLEAGVSLYDWEFRPVPEPTIDALAARLLERVEAGRESTEGLAVAALDLAGDAVTDLDAEYLRLDGETFPFYGESVEATAARYPRAAGDVYFVRQSLAGGDPDQPGLYSVTLFAFPREADAVAWLAAERTEATVYAADLPSAGDAFAYSYVTETAAGGPRRGYVGYGRVGDVGLIVELGATPEAPLAAFNEVVAAQLACLEEGTCLASPEVPAALTGTLAAAASEATPTP